MLKSKASGSETRWGRVPVARFCGAGPRGGCVWPLTDLHAVGAWVSIQPPGAEPQPEPTSQRTIARFR
jgi:hypothetical protein